MPCTSCGLRKGAQSKCIPGASGFAFVQIFEGRHKGGGVLGYYHYITIYWANYSVNWFAIYSMFFVFGHMDFIYSVVRFWSNVPVSTLISVVAKCYYFMCPLICGKNNKILLRVLKVNNELHNIKMLFKTIKNS